MGRPGKYLFKRPGSQMWWVRFQYTGKMVEVKGKRKEEFSLGTTNKEEAELLAMEHIFLHKASMLILKSNERVRFNGGPGGQLYSPGLHTDLNGDKIFATETEIIYLDEEGRPTNKIEKNISAKVNFAASFREIEEVKRYLPREPNRDSAFIDIWVRQRKISARMEADARNTWKLCRDLFPNKPINKLTRDDGRELVKRLEELGSGPATIRKKMGHLRAAANIALDDKKIDINPFEKVLPKHNNKPSGRFLDDEDMRIVRENFSLLSLHDQLLWKFIAYTGMRLSEPFQIAKEFEEHGIRYVHVGTKTETSYRRIPIPTELIPRFPPKIVGPVFSGDPEVVGKRLRYFLRKIGISYDKTNNTGSRQKVVHSLRHRARDRLRSLRCPFDIQNEIIGHERKTISVSYGRGYPVEDLLSWIDQIGY